MRRTHITHHKYFNSTLYSKQEKPVSLVFYIRSDCPPIFHGWLTEIFALDSPFVLWLFLLLDCSFPHHLARAARDPFLLFHRPKNCNFIFILYLFRNIHNLIVSSVLWNIFRKSVFYRKYFALGGNERWQEGEEVERRQIIGREQNKQRGTWGVIWKPARVQEAY